MKKVILGAALIVLGVMPAHAVTYFSTAGAPDTLLPGQSVIVDFEAPVAGVSYSGSFTIDANNVGGFRAPPAGDTTNYFGVPGTGDDVPGTATIDFTSYLIGKAPLERVSFYWGSIDTYNTLVVLGAGGSPLLTLTGSDINDPANGDQSSSATNRRVYFTFGAGETFTGFRFTSTQRAFEIDDIAAGTVPEPTTWATLIAGLGLVGVAMRRRRKPSGVTA